MSQTAEEEEVFDDNVHLVVYNNDDTNKREHNDNSSSSVLLLLLTKPTHVLVATSVREIPNGGIFCQPSSQHLLCSIAFPHGLQRIGDRSFFHCSSLVELYLPATLKQVGIAAFTKCTGLERIEFPTEDDDDDDDDASSSTCLLDILDDGCFAHCNSLLQLTSIPSSVMRIGKRAFAHCDKFLTHINLSHSMGLHRMEKEVFLACSVLCHVIVPISIIEIGHGSFAQCYELQSVQFGSDSDSSSSLSMLVSIGDQAFASCRSLHSILLPGSVQRIGTLAFSNCLELVSVEFAPIITTTTKPSSILRLGDQVFLGCKNLIQILLPEDEITMTTTNGSSISSNNGDEGRHLLFKGCTKLKERFAPASIMRLLKEEDLSELFLKEALSIRYHGLPYHALCYHQGHYTVEESLVQFESSARQRTEEEEKEKSTTMPHQQEEKEESLRRRTQWWWMDIFGMTPLHILAVSSIPNPKLLDAIITRPQRHEEKEDSQLWLVMKDMWGNLPLYYACRRCARSSAKTNLSLEFVQVLLKHHQQLASFEEKNDLLPVPLQQHLTLDDWDVCLGAALPNAVLICVLVKARFARRIQYLGSIKWRNDVLNDISNNLVVTTTTTRTELREALRLVEGKLQDYELQESIALVRMAAWKAKLLLDQQQQQQQLSRRISRNDEESETSNMTVYRENCWLNCGDQVIISNLLPFLNLRSCSIKKAEMTPRHKGTTGTD
eukprot:scaffold10675_cov89-Cylindrotheca_fusiformis.AAC.2